MTIKEWFEKYFSSTQPPTQPPSYVVFGEISDEEPVVDQEKFDIWLDGFEAGLARRDPQVIPTSVSRDVELILATALWIATNGEVVEISEQELRYMDPKPKVRISSDPSRRSILVQAFTSYSR